MNTAYIPTHCIHIGVGYKTTPKSLENVLKIYEFPRIFYELFCNFMPQMLISSNMTLISIQVPDTWNHVEQRSDWFLVFDMWVGEF